MEECFEVGGCHRVPIGCDEHLGECDILSNLTRKENLMESKEVKFELKIKIENKEKVEPNWMGIYIDDQEDLTKGKYGVVFIASIAIPELVRKNFNIRVLFWNKN